MTQFGLRILLLMVSPMRPCLELGSKKFSQEPYFSSGIPSRGNAMPSRWAVCQVYSSTNCDSTLEKIANEGPDVFYEGDIGRSVSVKFR